MDNLDQQLEDIIKRRKRAAENLERLKGRKEQAESNLASIEAECLKKKIDPNKIDEVIQQLETKYKSLIAELNTNLQEAERQIEPYVTGTTP